MIRLWHAVRRWFRYSVVRPFFNFIYSFSTRRGILYWLSLSWLFPPLRRFFRRFFRFEPPHWLKSVATVAAPPKYVRSTSQYFNPFFWLVWGVQFPITWVLSRPYLNLGPALPTILVAVFLVVGWFNGLGGATPGKIEQYRLKLNLALSTESYEEARVAARTLSDIFPDNQEYQRQLATIETKCGNQSAAAEMMNFLVRTKNDGTAALWLVNNILKLQDVKKWTAEQHQYFLKLIDIALQDLKGKNLDVAKGMMAFYLAETGNSRDALRFFADIAPRDEKLYLLAAVMAKRSGDDRTAADLAREGYRYFRAAVSTQPNNVELRISEAQCLGLMGNYEDAVKLLGDAYSAMRDERLKNEISTIYVEWANDLGKSGNVSRVLVQRLDLLRRALALTPESNLVSEAVADLIIDCAQNKDREVEVLRAALAQGISPGMMHFVEGTAALINGDSETARSRLELASQTMNDVPALLNNLAVALSEGENENLSRALELVNMADTQLPNHPYIHETRGQIYFKQKEYSKSIPDLEFALSAAQLRLGAYDSLRKAYREIGQVELANNYEKLYDDLKVLTDAAKDANLKSDELVVPELTPSPSTDKAKPPSAANNDDGKS
ncbi:MAG: hypothetical protein J0M26_06750 [Planctomycetes bacterium]|nr:hypothetical protein [Planctomycetota bacterium]